MTHLNFTKKKNVCNFKKNMYCKTSLLNGITNIQQKKMRVSRLFSVNPIMTECFLIFQQQTPPMSVYLEFCISLLHFKRVNFYITKVSKW